MDFLRTIRRRSFFSELVYFSLNIALAVAVLLVVRATESPLPAFVLIMLSKWRVLAVRPRYWVANIQANLVDFIVSISTVILLFSVNTASSYSLTMQLVLTVVYVAWLVGLKPRSTRRAVVAQAAVALFAGVSALTIISYAWPASLVVALMGLIGYVTARHVLTQYEEDHFHLISLLWALVLAQVGWVLYHWTIAYTVPIIDVRLPQLSIIAMCLGFALYKVYDSYKRHGEVRSADVLLPLLFSGSIVVILVLFFNGVSTGTI